MTAGESLRNLAARIDARTRRERMLLIAAGATIVLLAWDTTVRAPLAERQRVALEREAQVEADLATMRASEGTLREQLTALSSTRADEQVGALQARIAAVDGELQARTQGLISPHQMVAVLRAFVAGDERIELVALRNDAAEPIVTAKDAGAAVATVPRVFRHRVELVLRGEYFALLEYLRRVEGLEWRFRWDALNVTTLEYPIAEAVIVLSTLSFAEGWIGV
jgi:MSHA biogenesis protein MshJ